MQETDMTKPRYGRVVTQCSWCEEKLSRECSKPTLCTTCFKYASEQDQKRYGECATEFMRGKLQEWEEWEERGA